MMAYDIEIKEIYKCIASIQAESEENALQIAKSLYESGVLELDSEDITDTQYSVCK